VRVEGDHMTIFGTRSLLIESKLTLSYEILNMVNLGRS